MIDWPGVALIVLYITTAAYGFVRGITTLVKESKP